jgi:hypothetical protein
MVLHFFLWLALIPIGFGAVSTSKMEHHLVNQFGPDYETMEECELEASRILREMQLSYPDDKTMYTYCTDTKKPIMKENL